VTFSAVNRGAGFAGVFYYLDPRDRPLDQIGRVMGGPAIGLRLAMKDFGESIPRVGVRAHCAEPMTMRVNPERRQ
jgi:hypothetical protein